MSTLVFACLVKTNIKSEPFEDLIDIETPKSLHTVASPTPLPDSTPLACHAEESKDSDTSDARSTSSDWTAPLSPDHSLTRTSPTPTPTRASFHRRTARMTRYRSSYETPSSSSSLAFPVQKRYQGTSELILDTDSKEDEIGEEDTNKDEGHGLDDEGYGLDDEGRSVKSDGLGLEGEEEAVPEASRIRIGLWGIKAPRVSALRQPTLTTWIDLEDGIAYIDVPAYPPPAPPVQTPPLPEWSFGSLLVSLAPSTVPP
ncbi:hypothetical protein Tco_1580184, partial [Tanacetum coccineum]